MGKRKKKGFVKDFAKIWNETIIQSFQLPDLSMEFFTEEEMYSWLADLLLVKKELNNTKSLLSSFDIVQWRSHTLKLHKYEYVVPKLKYQVKTELVTQAWTKFYSILSSFKLIPAETLTVNTVHLCEAPGAFVTSLNHFVQNQSQGKQTLNWIATTLNPYYEGNELGLMIPDDRLIIETLPNWNFGVDFTGNIMSIKNFENLKGACGNSIHLVTADGSINCFHQPDEQENIVSLLLLWEVVTGLSILSHSGCFVLKIFTVFEKFTVSLLYLLKTVFKKVTLCKPGPSKPGNSEVYVVNQGFKKNDCMESDIFKKFLNAAYKMDYHSAVVDCQKIPKSFLVAIKDYVTLASSKQTQVIKENIELFGNLNTIEEEELKKLKNYIAVSFIKLFCIKDINNFISPTFGLKRKRSTSDTCLSTNNSCEPDAFVRPMLPLNARSTRETVGNKEDFSWYHSSTDLFNVDNFQNFEFLVGKCFTEINTSFFCSNEHLEKWRSLSSNVFEKSCTLISDHDIHQLKKCFANDDVFIKYTPFVFCELEEMVADGKNCLPVCLLWLNKKHEMVINLYKLFSNYTFSNSYLIFKFDHIPITFFWVGICFLIAQCCKETMFLKTTNESAEMYMICKQVDKSKLNSLAEYISRLNNRLLILGSDQDVLHLMPIYCLLKSEFKAFFSTKIQQFINEQDTRI